MKEKITHLPTKELLDRKRKELFITYPLLKEIAYSIAQQHGNAYLVGGTVRDMFLNQPVHDVDVEVHGLLPDQLEKILKQHGPVRTVGKSFGVFKIDGVAADWSLPRTDAAGRKPEVTVDPFLPLPEALKRRDLTINAMALDLISGAFHDPYNGLGAIASKMLSTPDPHFFVQDPLRFYRVMQFVGRFNMWPNKELQKVCIHMQVDDLSHERITQEFKKLFLLSEKPSRGIEWLKSTGKLKTILPDLAVLENVPQNPTWHPEGDVFEHTMQAMDAAASYNYPTSEQKFTMVLAALCHDLGKTSTTCIRNEKLTSYDHEIVGVPLAQHVASFISNSKEVVRTVTKLVRYHMAPVALVKNNAKPAAYKRLACKVAPECTLYDLYLLARADKSGRNPARGHPLSLCPEPLVEEFLQKIREYGVEFQPEKPLLQGKDFLDVQQPGPQLGKLVEHAYKLQIEKNITNPVTLKKIVLKDKI